MMKSIPGFEGFYKITEDGKVYSERSDRFLKESVKPNGYCYIELNVEGNVSYNRVHRLVAQTYLPNTDNKPYVNHLNGNKSDNRVSNLEWVTGSENNLHAVDNGLTRFNYWIYEVTDSSGNITRCTGQQEVRDLTGLCKNTITALTQTGRKSRSGFTVNIIERATTISRESRIKRSETGGDSKSS